MCVGYYLEKWRRRTFLVVLSLSLSRENMAVLVAPW